MRSLRHVRSFQKAFHCQLHPCWSHSTRCRLLNTTFPNKGKSSIECSHGDPLLKICKYTDFPNDQKVSIDQYVNYLLQENEKYNLTGLDTFGDCIDQLVDDTAALLPLIDQHFNPQMNLTVVDIGSGAGIPGVPLSIMRPNWKLVCIEATKKKCNFIQEAINLCKLPNIEVIRGRCEDIGHEESHRESYDLAISRGVASFPVLIEYCLPFLKLNGLFIAPKGSQVEMEVKSAQLALQTLGGKVLDIALVDSHGNKGQKTAILTQKIKPTPSRYPRRPGIPTKRPL